jgi:hypothetical protein
MKVLAGEAVKNGLIAVEIGEVPPLADTVMLPSQPGVQVGDVVADIFTAKAVG